MKRVVVSTLAFLVLGLGLGAGWLLKRRPAGTPPGGGDPSPFLIQSAGRGQLIEFQPSEIPIRSLRWSRPLPGRAVVAQLLSQSGRQRAYFFLDGHLQAVLTLDRPESISENLFRFAELEDAAYLPGQLLLLLYRVSPQGEPPLMVAWNLEKGTLQWALRGAGSRLTLSPGGRTAFLYGPDTPVQVLRLLGKDKKLLEAPATSKVDLPTGVAGFTDLLATGPADFLAVTGTGLSAWKAGAWNQTPAPARSALGFGAYEGHLARTGDTFWWQPEPGQLIQVDAMGKPLMTQGLSELLVGPQAQDASILHLLGADPQGGLWFAPVAPNFAPPPIEDSIPTLPMAAPEETAPTPAPGTPDNPPSAVPDPGATPGPHPSLQDTWEPYLKAGLDRLYRWKPGTTSMQGFNWTSTWPRLGPPAAIPLPSGDGGLVPESEAFLLGGPEHRWWLPLSTMPLDQPR